MAAIRSDPGIVLLRALIYSHEPERPSGSGQPRRVGLAARVVPEVSSGGLRSTQRAHTGKLDIARQAVLALYLSGSPSVAQNRADGFSWVFGETRASCAGHVLSTAGFETGGYAVQDAGIGGGAPPEQRAGLFTKPSKSDTFLRVKAHGEGEAIMVPGDAA
jgi:hypothetical protein